QLLASDGRILIVKPLDLATQLGDLPVHLGQLAHDGLVAIDLQLTQLDDVVANNGDHREGEHRHDDDKLGKIHGDQDLDDLAFSPTRLVFSRTISSYIWSRSSSEVRSSSSCAAMASRFCTLF